MIARAFRITLLILTLVGMVLLLTTTPPTRARGRHTITSASSAGREASSSGIPTAVGEEHGGEGQRALRHRGPKVPQEGYGGLFNAVAREHRNASLAAMDAAHNTAPLPGPSATPSPASPSSSSAGFLGFEDITKAHSRPFTVEYPPAMPLPQQQAMNARSHMDLIGRMKQLTDAIVPQGTHGDQRRPAAMFTMVRNEPVYVRAWIAHYSHTYLPQDLYVLDNNLGRDGSLEAFAGSGINIIPVACEAYYNDHNCLRASVSTAAASLLAAYKTVAFTEVDEFLFAVAEGLTLWDFMCGFKGDATRVDTRTVIENRTEDTAVLALANETGDYSRTSVSPPFNWNMDAASGGGRYAQQRYWWYKDHLYQKPLIFSRPMRWSNGFHYARLGPPMRYDALGRPTPVLDFLVALAKPSKRSTKYETVTRQTKDVVLLHVHRIDKAYFTRRGEWKAQQVQRDQISPHAKYNGSKLEKFYWGDWDEYDQLRTPIPAWWLAVEERHLSQQPTGFCRNAFNTTKGS